MSIRVGVAERKLEDKPFPPNGLVWIGIDQAGNTYIGRSTILAEKVPIHYYCQISGAGQGSIWTNTQYLPSGLKAFKGIIAIDVD